MRRALPCAVDEYNRYLRLDQKLGAPADDLPQDEACPGDVGDRGFDLEEVVDSRRLEELGVDRPHGEGQRLAMVAAAERRVADADQPHDSRNGRAP